MSKSSAKINTALLCYGNKVLSYGNVFFPGEHQELKKIRVRLAQRWRSIQTRDILDEQTSLYGMIPFFDEVGIPLGHHYQLCRINRKKPLRPDNVLWRYRSTVENLMVPEVITMENHPELFLYKKGEIYTHLESVGRYEHVLRLKEPEGFRRQLRAYQLMAVGAEDTIVIQMTPEEINLVATSDHPEVATTLELGPERHRQVAEAAQAMNLSIEDFIILAVETRLTRKL